MQRVERRSAVVAPSKKPMTKFGRPGSAESLQKSQTSSQHITKRSEEQQLIRDKYSKTIQDFSKQAPARRSAVYTKSAVGKIFQEAPKTISAKKQSIDATTFSGLKQKQVSAFRESTQAQTKIKFNMKRNQIAPSSDALSQKLINMTPQKKIKAFGNASILKTSLSSKSILQPSKHSSYKPTAIDKKSNNEPLPKRMGEKEDDELSNQPPEDIESLDLDEEDAKV